MQTSSGAILTKLENGYLRKSFPKGNIMSEHACKGQFTKLQTVNEYCTTNSIDCPSPKVTSLNVETEPYHYDMEFIEGVNLKDYRFKDDQEIINVVIMILEGLKVWHEAGVCHNDLHSNNGENILIQKENKIKIIDPIVTDRSSTEQGYNPKFLDFLSTYRMIIEFIYPKISNTTKDKINNSLLRETYRSEINSKHTTLQDFIDNNRSNEINRAYIDKNITQIIENLKNIVS